jgi:predicted ferric reductase
MILDRIIAQSGDVFVSTADRGSRAEIIRKMIEGIKVTQWAISHYQATLVGVVLIFTVWNGIDKFSRSRRAAQLVRQPKGAARLEIALKGKLWERRRNRDGSLSSGSSTTLFGDNCGPSGSWKPNEQTSLLSRRSIKPTLFSRIHSYLMYQPLPIPFFNKTLPENATTLLILALFAINILYTVIGIVWEVPLTLVLSDRVSLIFAANLPWLYILGAKNQPLRLLTGYSYEHLNILHRRLGEWLCFLAIVHAVTMFIVWYTFFLPVGRSLGWFLTESTVYLGLITLFCYQMLYATSLASFRKWWYELFLGLHVGFQAAALGFLYFHHRGSKPYVRITLAIFLLDRLLFRLLVKSREFKADVKVMPDGDTVLLSASWPVALRRLGFLTALFSHNMHQGWAPAEHVFLTIPSLARKHVFQAHPFTVASAAPGSEQQHAWFDLIIRALDGFTRDLLIYAQTHSSVSVRLDGPYGSSHAFDMLRSSDVAIAVVGGSGIAVAYPMLWALLQPVPSSKSSKSSSSGSSDIESASPTQPPRRKVALIWIVHQADHRSWLGQERLDELASLGLNVITPPPTRTAGRPDVAALVRGTIEELTSADDAGRCRVGVMCSGPDSMNRTARNSCAAMAGEGRNVEVSVEKFGW